MSTLKAYKLSSKTNHELHGAGIKLGLGYEDVTKHFCRLV